MLTYDASMWRGKIGGGAFAIFAILSAWLLPVTFPTLTGAPLLLAWIATGAIGIVGMWLVFGDKSSFPTQAFRALTKSAIAIASGLMIGIVLVGIMSLVFRQMSNGNSNNGNTTVTGVSVAQLSDFYIGRTHAAADRLFKPFVGTPVQITGVVTDVRDEPFSLSVNLEKSGQVSMYLKFNENQRVHVNRLSAGDRIIVKCSVEFGFEGAVSFKDCFFRGTGTLPSPASSTAP